MLELESSLPVREALAKCGSPLPNEKEFTELSRKILTTFQKELDVLGSQLPTALMPFVMAGLTSFLVELEFALRRQKETKN